MCLPPVLRIVARINSRVKSFKLALILGLDLSLREHPAYVLRRSEFGYIIFWATTWISCTPLFAMLAQVSRWLNVEVVMTALP